MIIVIDYFLLILGDLKTRFKLSLSLCLSYWDCAYKQVMPKTSGDSRDMVQAVFRMDCIIKDPLFGTPGKGRTVQTVEFEEVGIS